MDIQLSIPRSVAARVETAFKKIYQHDEGSGVTAQAFVKDIIGRFIVETVQAHEANEAAENARKNAVARAAGDIKVS